MPLGVVVEHVFLLPNDDSIDDRLDAGHPARDSRRPLRFVLDLDPAGELDGALADGADVDAALAQDGIVAEGLEDALLERGVETLIGREASRDAVMVHVLAAQSRDPVAQPRRQSRNAADLLRHDDADDDAGRDADPDLREGAAERLALVAITKWSHAIPCGGGGIGRVAFRVSTRE